MEFLVMQYHKLSLYIIISFCRHFQYYPVSHMYNPRMWSNIKSTSVCFTWPVRGSSMSLAYIGVSSRGEAAALVLFPINVFKFYKRTKWPAWLKIVASLMFVRWSDFYKQKECQRDTSQVYGQKLFSRKKVSVCCNRYLDGRTALNDDSEKHRQTKDPTHWCKLCHCRGFDKGRSKKHAETPANTVVYCFSYLKKTTLQ
jgi:hypothetical protein